MVSDDPTAIHPERIAKLAALDEDWDIYGGHPPTAEALAVLTAMAVVPTPDGGLQIEWHIHGWDVEIGINHDGTPDFVSMDRRHAH